METTEPIHRTIERFVRTGEGDFERCSMALFAEQYEKNAFYRSYCDSFGKTPSTLQSWKEIPAVPTTSFKSDEWVPFPTEYAAAVFYSSTTTGQTPSRHYLKTLQYYETAIQSGFSKNVYAGTGVQMIILTPSPAEAPRSSLSWMMSVVTRKWGTPCSAYFVKRGILDDLSLFRALDKAKKDGVPVAILGTTLWFGKLFEQCRKFNKSFQCLEGSLVMDTGGSKSLTKELPREEFLKDVQTYLSIPENRCINEYGMCELSSQFYGVGKNPVLKGPAWVRSLVVDPQTGNEVASGEVGVLRHFDLANVDSIMAIQTSDLAEAKGDGFILKGRAVGAEPRGCSLNAAV